MLPVNLSYAAIRPGEEIGAVRSIGFPTNTVVSSDDRTMWVASFDDELGKIPTTGNAIVMSIDSESLRPVASVVAASGDYEIPSGMGLSPDDQYLWIYGGRTLTRIATGPMEVAQRITVPPGPDSMFSWAVGLAISPRGDRLWLGNQGFVQAFDTRENRIVASLSVPRLQKIALSEDGRRLYALSLLGGGAEPWSCRVSLIDTAGFSVTAVSQYFPGLCSDLALSPDEVMLAVSTYEDGIYILDPGTLLLTGQIPNLNETRSVAFDPRGSQLWIADSANSIRSINLMSRSFSTPLPVRTPSSLAFNSDGSRLFVGQFLDNSLLVMNPFTTPGKPRDVSVKPISSTSVKVTWVPPADDGGSTIRQYRVTASPGGRSCTSSSSSCVIRGLASRSNYRFAVEARNEIGDGPALDQVRLTLPRVPDAPRAIRAKRSGNSVTISWEPPRTTGGSPIRAYEVLASPTSRVCRTSGSQSCSITLPVGRQYTFTVRAINRFGKGEPRRSSVVTIPAPQPTIPPVPKPERVIS